VVGLTYHLADNQRIELALADHRLMGVR